MHSKIFVMFFVLIVIIFVNFDNIYDLCLYFIYRQAEKHSQVIHDRSRVKECYLFLIDDISGDEGAITSHPPGMFDLVEISDVSS